MSDNPIDSSHPERYTPPEHQDPATVDDAATRHVHEFNEAQRQDTEADQRWTNLRALHNEPYRDASHRQGGLPGGWQVGGAGRPSRSDRRGWDNKRDDPHREDEFVPPDQMPPRGTPPGVSKKPPLIDLSPAAERRTGGAGMTSFSEAAAAAQQAKGYTESEVGGAIHLIKERTDSTVQAVLLTKRAVEDSVTQFLAAWGDLTSAQLNLILQSFSGIQDQCDDMLRAMELVANACDEILSMALPGISEATDTYVAGLSQ